MQEQKITGKVKVAFNDAKDNLKKYEVGSEFTSNEERYKELKEKGYLSEGKKVKKDIFKDKFEL